MQFILDHIVATMVSSAIFLMLIFVMVDNQMLAVDTTNHRALKKQELDFIKMLKVDLHGISQVQSISEDLATGEFKFRAQLSRSDTTKYAVIYKRKVVGTRGDAPLYQIQRYQDGAKNGASMVTVTKWTIEARNNEGGAITDTDDAAQIYVLFEAAGLFEEAEPVGRSQWEATFHPPLLKNDLLL